VRMVDRKEIEKLFQKHGCADYKWIAPDGIVVAQWVRMKCMYGCATYGKNASCPPNTPTVAECRQLFGEYREGVVFHFEKALDQPESRHAWTKKVNRGLLELERNVFLLGYQKAFLLFMDSCDMCAACAGVREECKQPKKARPTPEALAVDVFSTVRQYGYPIEVLADYAQIMNRYAFLLIE